MVPGAIAGALGGVGFFLFVLFTALWYPFKRLLRRRRGETTAAFRQDGEPHADTGAEDGALPRRSDAGPHRAPKQARNARTFARIRSK